MTAAVARARRGFTLIEILVVMAIVAVVVSLAAVSFSPRQRTYDEAEDLRSAFVELAERSVFDGRARGADIWREGMRALARDGGRWRASGDLLEWEKLRVVSLRVDSARVEILDFADEQERAEEAARRKNPTQSSSPRAAGASNADESRPPSKFDELTAVDDFAVEKSASSSTVAARAPSSAPASVVDDDGAQGEALVASENPPLAFYADGLTTVFELRVADENGREIEISADGAGKIEIKREPK